MEQLQGIYRSKRRHNRHGRHALCFRKETGTAVKRYKEFIKGIGESSPLKKAVGSVLGDETFRQKAITYKGIPDKTEIPEIKKIEAKHKIEEIIKAG